VGAALKTLTSLQSERSGTTTEKAQKLRQQGKVGKTQTRGEGKGVESGADNPDQSAVREARHHLGRGSTVEQTTEKGAKGEQQGKGVETLEVTRKDSEAGEKRQVDRQRDSVLSAPRAERETTNQTSRIQLPL